MGILSVPKTVDQKDLICPKLVTTSNATFYRDFSRFLIIYLICLTKVLIVLRRIPVYFTCPLHEQQRNFNIVQIMNVMLSSEKPIVGRYHQVIYPRLKNRYIF